jgi:exoribonuclease R
MVRTNLRLCETHMSDDETHEWIIHPEKWRIFASHHSSLSRNWRHKTLNSNDCMNCDFARLRIESQTSAYLAQVTNQQVFVNAS